MRRKTKFQPTMKEILNSVYITFHCRQNEMKLFGFDGSHRKTAFSIKANHLFLFAFLVVVVVVFLLK